MLQICAGEENMSPALECCGVLLPVGGGRRLLGQEVPLGRKHGENNGSLTRPACFGVSVFFYSIHTPPRVVKAHLEDAKDT